MVEFAPQLPTGQEPNYLNFFRPARPFQGNQAGKVAGQGYGHAIASGAEALDNVMKKAVVTETHRQADPEQEAMTKSLEQTWNAAEGGTQQPQAGGGTQALGYNENNLYDLDKFQQEDVPEPLRQGLGTAQTLQDAREYGKIPYTYYLGRLNEIAKSLRAQYPAYRDQVDATMHQITGHPIGNAYMMSLIGDIQSKLSGKDKEKERVQAELDKQSAEGDTFINHVATLHRQGQIPTAYASYLLSKSNAKKYEINTQEKEFQFEDAKNKDFKRKSSQLQNNVFGDMVTKIMQTNSVQFQGKMTSWAQIQEGINSGKIKIDPNNAALLGEQLAGVRAAARLQMENWAKSHWDKEGITHWSRDSKQVSENIDNALGVLDEYSKSLADPNHLGPAHYFAHRVELMQNNEHWKAMTGSYGQKMKELSLFMAATRQFKDIPAFQEVVAKHMTENAAALDELNNYLSEKSVALPHFNEMGMTNTLEKDLTNVKRVAVDDEGNPLKIDYSKYFEYIPRFAKLSRQMQENYALYLFDGANRNVLDHFKQDDVHPDTGQPVNSQYSVYSMLTGHTFTQAIAKLGSQYQDAQKTWAENNFRALFSSSIRSISNIPNIPGIAIKYSPETHSLESFIDQSKIQGTYAAAVARKKELDGHLYNLNIGLRGLNNIESASKTDTNDYLLGMLRNVGYDPKKMPTSSATDVLDNIMIGIYKLVHPETPGRRERQEEQE